MTTLESLRAEKRSGILRLADNHGCRNVRVFGSLSTSSAHPGSDVDFLVDLDPGRGLLDLGAFLIELQNYLKSDADVVESGSLHPYIRDRVLREAVAL